MATREQLLQQFIVRPGEAAGIAARDPGWTGGTEFPDLAADERQERAIDALERGSAELVRGAGAAVGERPLRAARRPPGDGRRRQGLGDQARDARRQPAGRAGRSRSRSRRRRSSATTSCGGSRARCPSAGASASSTAPTTRRSSRSRCTRSGSSRSGSRPASATRRSGRTRYEDINGFERHLDRSGTKVVKFFLHVSRAAQKERFLARLDQPGKEWKFNAADVAERQRFDEYLGAFEDALDGDVDPVGAVVRGPGRPLVDHAGDRRAGARRDARLARPALARGLARRSTPRTWRRAGSSRPSRSHHDGRMSPSPPRLRSRGTRSTAAHGSGSARCWRSSPSASTIWALTLRSDRRQHAAGARHDDAGAGEHRAAAGHDEAAARDRAAGRQGPAVLPDAGAPESPW